MTEQEMLMKIQAVADETAQRFPFKRTAQIDILYTEKLEDGSTDCYCYGSDMPILIYRVFNVKEDGTCTEYTDINVAGEKTRHYNMDVRTALGDKAPLVTGENGEYEIVLENHIDNGGVEIKLKSNTGRDLTMVEIYRYFDYVSKIYFVCCVSLSFGGQYLFSVMPDSKHLKLIVSQDPTIRSRVNMMDELLRNRLLPSYQTIAAGAQLLAGKDANGNAIKAHITLNDQNGVKTDFDSTFCYDDQETQTRFAFFANSNDVKQGVILISNIFDQKLYMSDRWTDAQKAAVDRIKALMKDNPEEFNKHAVSFFCDDLDFRYNAFKNGTLKNENGQPTQTPAEQPAEAPAAPEKAE